MEWDVSLPAAGAQSSRAVHDLRGSEEADPEGRPQRGQSTLLILEQILTFQKSGSIQYISQNSQFGPIFEL